MACNRCDRGGPISGLCKQCQLELDNEWRRKRAKQIRADDEGGEEE